MVAQTDGGNCPSFGVDVRHDRSDDVLCRIFKTNEAMLLEIGKRKHNVIPFLPVRDIRHGHEVGIVVRRGCNNGLPLDHRMDRWPDIGIKDDTANDGNKWNKHKSHPTKHGRFPCSCSGTNCRLILSFHYFHRCTA